MSAMNRLKKILFTPLGRRMSKEDVNQSRGMALIMVMVSTILVSAIGLDMRNNEQVRFRLALNTADSIKAEALAEGALNWGRLFLTLSSKIQEELTKWLSKGLITLPANTVWDLVSIDDQNLKSLVAGTLGKFLFPGEVEEKAEAPKSGTMFGNFDGKFEVKVVDEESKISLGELGTTSNQEKKNRIRKLLGNLIAPPRYDDMFETGGFSEKVDRATVIANIYDWLDADDARIDPYEQDDQKWGRTGSGSEKDSYADKEGPLPKNAYFDSLQELRLVKGVDDDFEQSFFDAITIYGEGGKINILSAKDQVVEALMRYCVVLDPSYEEPDFSDDLLKGWKDYPKGGNFVSPIGFMSFLEGNKLKVNRPLCQNAMDVKSNNFTLTAKATICRPGQSDEDCRKFGVTRTLTLVTRIVGNAEEKYYFRSH